MGVGAGFRLLLDLGLVLGLVLGSRRIGSRVSNRRVVSPNGYGSDEPTDSSIVSPQRQTERSFECPDALWEELAALAREEGASVDWLLNEAMKAYAQQRARPIAPREVTLSEHPRERNTPTLPRAYLRPQSARRSTMPAAPPPSQPGRPRPRLTVVYAGARYEVTKERFVVGRGSLASDLAIDDPRVSRQHALIESAGGSYYLVDLGSTNGVEYQGERIERKRIDDGDRVRICEYELEFLVG